MALTGDTDADLGTADLPRIASSSFTRRCSAAAFSRVAWATASDLAVARGNSTGEPKCGAGRARNCGLGPEAASVRTGRNGVDYVCNPWTRNFSG